MLELTSLTEVSLEAFFTHTREAFLFLLIANTLAVVLTWIWITRASLFCKGSRWVD